MNYSMKAFALMNSERDGEKQNEGWGVEVKALHICVLKWVSMIILFI